MVVSTVKHSVVSPEEDVAKDPERLAVLRAQVGGGDVNGAIATLVL